MDTKRINKPKAVAIGLFHVVAGAAMIWWAVGSNPFSGPPAYARHYEEGRRLMAEGRPEAALARFEITIRDKGDFAEGHYARALALYQLGQFMEAREGFEAALRREPNMYLALRNLAAPSVPTCVRHRPFPRIV